MAKINYPFIFEFDSRHNLDWHQLAEVIYYMECRCSQTNVSIAALPSIVLTWSFHVAELSADRCRCDVPVLACPAGLLYRHNSFLPRTHPLSQEP